MPVTRQPPPLTLRDELQMIAAKWKRPKGPQRPGDRASHQYQRIRDQQ